VIFAVKVLSLLKLGQIYHVLAPKFFWRKPIKILDSVFKIQPSRNYGAKFRGGRPMEITRQEKKKRKDAPAKYKSALKSIASGRTN